MLVFSKKERSWQSSYAKRKVASHPSPFLPWPTSEVSVSGSTATTALCRIGLMPMMALPQTENYARGFQVQMYFPHCQFAATERKTLSFLRINTPAVLCYGCEGGFDVSKAPKPCQRGTPFHSQVSAVFSKPWGLFWGRRWDTTPLIT